MYKCSNILAYQQIVLCPWAGKPGAGQSKTGGVQKHWRTASEEESAASGGWSMDEVREGKDQVLTEF